MTNVPKPPGGGPVWAAIVAIFGAFGTIFDVKHAYLSVSAKLQDCVGFLGCTDHIMRLEDDVFGGFILWAAIMVVSLLALVLGARSLIHHLRYNEHQRQNAKPVKKPGAKRPSRPAAQRRATPAAKLPPVQAGEMQDEA